MTEFISSWGLSETLWLCSTIVAYTLARRLQKVFGNVPLANPVLLAGVPLGLIIWLGDFPFASYQLAGQALLFLLGPATVALAIPFHRNWRIVRSQGAPFLIAMAAGSVATVLSGLAIAWALGAGPDTLASMAPKAVTTPIAIGIAEQIGGIASLTAAFVIFSGVIGAMLGGPLLTLLGVKDHAARGAAYGTAAGGIGTAQAFQEDQLAGTFAGISVTVNGVLTAILLPILWWVFV